MYVVRNLVLSQLGFALASQAERINLSLGFVVCELNLRDSEIAGQLQSIRNVGFAGWKVQVRFQTDITGHDRRVRANSKLQEVVNSALLYCDIEFYVMTLWIVGSYNEAFGYQGSAKNFAVHRL